MTRSLILMAVLAALAGCEREPAPSKPAALVQPQTQPTSTVWGGMTSRPDLTTFTDAASAAGVESLLRSGGPWTVFAPTNDAFAKWPVERREPLLQPEHRDDLRAVVTYHVAPGRLTAADLAARATQAGGQFELMTVEGDAMKVAFTEGRLTIEDGAGAIASIVEPDEAAANGVFHTLDTALQKNSPAG